MNKKLLILASLFALVIPASFAYADSSNVIYDQCYLSKIKGTNIGHACVTQKIVNSNDKSLIVTTRHSDQQFERLGFTVKITEDAEYTEDNKGNPVSFSSKVQSPGENVDINGEFVAPNKLSVTSVINGNSKKQEITLKKKILFPYAADKLFKDNINEDTIEYSTIDTSNALKIVTYTAKKIGQEALPEYNLNDSYTKYKVSMDFLPFVSNYEWLDKDGHLIREKLSLLDLEDVIAPKEQIITQPKEIDLLGQSLIPIEDDLPDPTKLDNVSYKIEVNNLDTDKLFASDSRQRIIQIKGNDIYLKIKKEKSDGELYSYPVNAKGKGEFLKSGPFIITTDDKIKIQANALVGQDKNAYKIVKRMEKWVYDCITKKDFAVNFANSSQVIRSKEGDCTEHAVLLAALLRAAGIPSKVVIGLIYTDNPQKAFGYHMWVKAYIGKWINLDPSFPGEIFIPTHIELSETALNSLNERSDAVLNLMRSISNLKISIINYVSSSITNVDLSKTNNSKIEKVALLDVLKNKDSQIKSISLKTSDGSHIESLETTTKTQEDYIRSAYYDFSQGNIEAARDEMDKASQFIAFNDDYSTVNQAIKEASLGFFSLADKRLKSLHDPEIWTNQIRSLRNICFPKQIAFTSNENILANALSKIDFQNNPDSAISLIKDNHDAFIRNDYAYYLLFKAYKAKNDQKNAIYYLNKAIKINPENLSYQLDLAKMYSLKKNYSKSYDILNDLSNTGIQDTKFINSVNVELYWVKAQKHNADSLYYLSKYYAEKGEFQTAIDILSRTTRESRKDSKHYSLLGDIYYKTNDINKARSSYEQAYDLDKYNKKAIIGLGNILLSEGNYKDALERYKQALRIDSDDVDTNLHVANAYELLAEEETAYRFYNQILDSDPNNSTANYKIGLMYLEHGNTEKASQMFKKALSVDMSYQECWMELAKSEIKRKNFFLAKEYLIPVNRINPQNPQYYYYMGIVYKNNENYPAAKASFEQALNLKRDYSEASEQLKELD